MIIEYEYGGVIYHEPLPRVLLLNFWAAGALKTQGHNTKSCEIKKVPGNPPTKRLVAPVPPHEVDILFVRDRSERELIGSELAPDQLPRMGIVSFSGEITWPSGYRDFLQSFCQEILARGGACVFFVSDPDGQLLKAANLGIIPDPERKLWPDRTAYRLPPQTEFEILASFVRYRIGIFSVCVGLAADPARYPVHLLLDSASVPYAVAGRRSFGVKPGLVVCLPDYGDSADVIHGLLSEVLPELVPHLFPFRRDLSWLKEAEFRHPQALTLEADKQDVLKETKQRLDALDARIQALEEGEQYLRDLLTSAGGQLKDAVKKIFEILFGIVGVAAVEVLDVDSDPALRGGSSEKREDLRIEWDGTFFLLNVSGREQYFKHDSINQLDKHRRLFLRANPNVPNQKEHSLLIGNFNYAGGLDPRKRGEMFGSASAQAEERLLTAGHGAISSFDLYRLYRAIQCEEVMLRAEDLLRLLNTEGILDFETYRTSLGRPKTSG